MQSYFLSCCTHFWQNRLFLQFMIASILTKINRFPVHFACTPKQKKIVGEAHAFLLTHIHRHALAYISLALAGPTVFQLWIMSSGAESINQTSTQTHPKVLYICSHTHLQTIWLRVCGIKVNESHCISVYYK